MKRLLTALAAAGACALGERERQSLVSLTFRDSLVTIDGRQMGFRGATTLVWERRGGGRWLISYADADHYPLAAP